MEEVAYKGIVERLSLSIRLRKSDKKVVVRYESGGIRLRPSDIVLLGNGGVSYQCSIPVEYRGKGFIDYEVRRGVLGNVVEVLLKYG